MGLISLYPDNLRHLWCDSVSANVRTQAANIGGRKGTVFQSHRSIQSRENKTETGMRCTTVSGTGHTYIHTYMHLTPSKHLHNSIYTYIYKYTYMHVYIHAYIILINSYIEAYIHTYISNMVSSLTYILTGKWRKRNSRKDSRELRKGALNDRNAPC